MTENALDFCRGSDGKSHPPMYTMPVSKCAYHIGVTLPVPLWAVHNYTIDILYHLRFSFYCMFSDIVLHCSTDTHGGVTFHNTNHTLRQDTF